MQIYVCIMDLIRIKISLFQLKFGAAKIPICAKQSIPRISLLLPVHIRSLSLVPPGAKIQSLRCTVRPQAIP